MVGGDVNYREVGLAYWGFHVDFWMNPSAINVTIEQSIACSSHVHNVFGIGGSCFGKNAGDNYADESSGDVDGFFQ